MFLETVSLSKPEQLISNTPDQITIYPFDGRVTLCLLAIGTILGVHFEGFTWPRNDVKHGIIKFITSCKQIFFIGLKPKDLFLANSLDWCILHWYECSHYGWIIRIICMASKFFSDIIQKNYRRSDNKPT